MNDQLRKIIKQLKRNGYKIQRMDGGHLGVYLDDNLIYTLPHSPRGGRSRSISNIKAELKRKGLL